MSICISVCGFLPPPDFNNNQRNKYYTVLSNAVFVRCEGQDRSQLTDSLDKMR